MSILFAQILNMSLTASVVILCVMAVRLLLKKAPKIFSYALWAVVLFRLLCPVSLTAPVSVLEVTSPQVTNTEGVSIIYYEPVESALVESGWQSARVRQEPISIQELEQRQADTTPSVLEIASWLWLAGMAVMLLHSMVSYLRLYRNLIGAVPWRGNVYLADHIGSPFVLGVVFPKIYLPSDTPMAERRYILAHERHHIRRLDHIIKLLAYGALCIHWFNPLVWAAFLLAGKDMEMSCDEAVIKKLGEHVRADYSASLLRLATHRRVIAGTPLAFGEGDTKGRVKNMAKWKKPKLWVSILCPVLCAAILVACAVNPEQDDAVGTAQTEAKPATESVSIAVQGNAVTYGELTLSIPEGYEAVEEERSVVLMKDGQNIGGITHWPMTDYLPVDMEQWVCDLGIPEALEARELREAREAGQTKESIAFMIDGSGNYLTAWYGNELDYSKLNREHNLFVADTVVYDIWFDENQISDIHSEKFLRTVYISGEPTVITVPEENTQTVAVGSIPPGYSIQIGQFPQGYTFEMDEYGNVLFLDGIDIIGGVTSYAIPKGVYDPEDEVFNWLEDVGIPDYEDSSLSYQGGMTFFDDQWSAEFASDVPEGTEPTVERHHHFSVIGDRVFDCWVDLPKVEWDIFMDIHNAVKITDNTEPGETEALYKCHAVLKAVQSGSSHISLERRYDADTGPSDYTQEYLQHQNLNHNEWLSIITVQIAGTAEKHANLYADGRYFNNMGKWSEEEFLWTEMKTEADPLRPWLTSFQWNEETVTYMDTLLDGSGECVMLRIDEPFVVRTEETEEHYFVNFYFDSEGNFVKAKISVNLFMDDEFTQTESIVTLENLRVFNKINEEYQRATAS